jgi:hypothetical protein
LNATHMSQCHPTTKPIQKLRRLLKIQQKSGLAKELSLMRLAISERRKKIAALTATH